MLGLIPDTQWLQINRNISAKPETKEEGLRRRAMEAKLREPIDPRGKNFFEVFRTLSHNLTLAYILVIFNGV